MRSAIAAAYRGLKVLARPLVGTVTSVDTAENVAALTFDDGPDPRFTPRLLDVLNRYEARATFFMVGHQASRHPEIVERVADAGHELANHSWDHPSFAHLPARECRRQIRACARELRPHGRRLFRAPGGQQTPMSALQARLLLHDLVGWSIDPRDYTDRRANDIADDVSGQLQPGSIVLLHDAISGDPSNDRSATIDAVDLLLSRHADQWHFLTLPELFRLGGRRRINWFWHTEQDPFRD